MYTLLGKNSRTAELVREIFDRFYLSKPDGLCGNDDCGQMSAWYMFSALGFYPVDPVSLKYVIGAPQIPQAKVKLQNGKVFTMIAHNLSKENKYVKTVFKSHTAGAHKIIRKCRASEVDCLSRCCLDNSKDIKVSEMQMQGCRNRLWWDDDHKYYTCKPELLEREIESGKTISDNRTYSYL